MRLGYLSRRAGALELLSSRFVGSGAEAWKAKMSASIFPTPAPHGEEKEAQEPLWGAKIVAVRDLLAGRRASGSREGAVRLLKLRVGDEPKDSGGSKLQGCGLRYSGGQWVDMFIPGIKQIGGYTITSCQNLPMILARAVDAPEGSNELELIVRQARHPPAAWVHSKACAVGAEVDLRVGGVFTLSHCGLVARGGYTCSNVILVGGGVGLNPLYSMLLEMASDAHSGEDTTVPKMVNVVYSVKTQEDAVLLQRLEALSSGPMKGRMRVTVCLTGGDGEGAASKLMAGAAPVQYRRGRVDQTLFAELLDGHPPLETRSLVCGPKGMAEEVREMLGHVGVAPERVHFESWW